MSRKQFKFWKQEKNNIFHERWRLEMISVMPIDTHLLTLSNQTLLTLRLGVYQEKGWGEKNIKEIYIQILILKMFMKVKMW